MCYGYVYVIGYRFEYIYLVVLQWKLSAWCILTVVKQQLTIMQYFDVPVEKEKLHSLTD